MTLPRSPTSGLFSEGEIDRSEIPSYFLSFLLSFFFFFFFFSPRARLRILAERRLRGLRDTSGTK